MGFLIKYIKILSFILILVLINACTQPIALKRVRIDFDGVTSFGNSLERNFYIPKNIGDSLKLKWKVDAHGSFPKTQVSVYNEYVFAPDQSGRLYAFNRETGLIEGYEVFKGETPAGLVIETNKAIFIHNNEEKTYFSLIYFNFVFSKVHDRIDISGKAVNELIKLDDGIIILTEQGTAYKYDFIGNQVWKYESEEYTLSSPASNGEIIIWGTAKGNLICINKDGKLIYKQKLGNRFEAGVTLNNNEGFITDSNGDVFSFNIKDGSKIWKYKTGKGFRNVPVHNGSNIFVSNLGGGIYCLDYKTGKEIWKNESTAIYSSTPLLFNDYLVQPDMQGLLYFVNTKNGAIDKVIEYPQRIKTAPTFFDNTLYIGIDWGVLYAYEAVNAE